MSLTTTMTSSLSREVVMKQIQQVGRSSTALVTEKATIVDAILTLAAAMVYVGDSIHAHQGSTGKSLSN